MRIGVMGGTLDPVHYGHIAIATETSSALQLERILLLPAGDPPHKSQTTDKADRLKMAELAAAEYAGISVCDMEINRPGVTYTVDTLEELSRMYPGAELIYIVGADTLNVLDSWKSFQKVTKLCSFAVVRRPGYAEITCQNRAREISAKYGAQIVLLALNGPDISSSEIRRRVAEGKDIISLTPQSVINYIREKGLYLCDYTEEQVVEKLKTTISPHRFAHTLGVASTAERLAERYGVDSHRARLAALLHDCAKSMNYAEMRRMAMEYVEDADQEELDSEPVLHAPAGMVLAYIEYGVRDPVILNAIRRHTLGGSVMTAMDALIYVSDFIEPGRAEFPGLAEVRKISETDIFEAMRLCAKLTSDYLKRQGKTPHPRTLEMLNMT